MILCSLSVPFFSPWVTALDWLEEVRDSMDLMSFNFTAVGTILVLVIRLLLENDEDEDLEGA